MIKQTNYDKQQLYKLESLGKKSGITYINDIVNKTNGHFMSHNELQENTTLKPITLLHYKYTQVYQITALKL